MPKLRDLIAKDAIVPQLTAAKRDEAVEELVDALVQAGEVAKSLRDTLVKLILDREKKGSTGFGKGVAVPHVKHEKIRKMAATIGISADGIDFNALDKAPVYTIFLLLSPADKPDEHLQAMENVFSHLQRETFRRFLRQASTTAEVMELIEEADGQEL
jgi:mannitol/fructose-specific phosphotransferase system IIA component (Ntr-type)